MSSLFGSIWTSQGTPVTPRRQQTDTAHYSLGTRCLLQGPPGPPGTLGRPGPPGRFGAHG